MDKYRILLVDDEPNILNALRRLFRTDQIKILTAQNGREALEIFKREPIQVLITDNLMPEMTGIELIKRVKQSYPDTIRIILSGQSDLQAVLTAINQGEAFRFVLKPWNDIDLKAAVSLALAHYKLAEDNKHLIRELREKNQVLDLLHKRHPELFDPSQPVACCTIDDSVTESGS